MFVTRQSLPRRTFLRGLGATLSLPLLEAMVPALTAMQRTAAAPTRRIGFLYHPMGTIYDQWTPTAEGASFAMPRILTPLEPLRDQMLVVTGLCHNEGASKGDGSFPHPRAGAVWLSGVHAAAVTTVGAEVRLGVTADQLAARTLGKETILPSLELSLEQPSAFGCEGGTCLFSSTLSWQDEKTPVPMESHPRIVFERLFGSGDSVEQRRRDRRWDASLLDSIAEDAARLRTRLGAGDRTRLNEYLDSVREVEQRIGRTEERGATVVDLPERPTTVPADWAEHATLMFDLQVLAFQTDMTRVFSMMMGRELSGHVFKNLGQSEQHHIITHHRHDQRLIEQKVQIDVYHMQVLKHLLDKMQATPDGDGSLLDHSILVYGSAMGDGNQHAFHDIPTLVFGKGAGGLRTGRHVKHQDVPMTNLLVSLLDKVGVQIDTLGDSTGTINLG
ncbi:MAG: DUF1552 domain-containing protein [Acidobacteriota bacterium]